MMNRYEKSLVETLSARCAGRTASEVLAQLFESGLLHWGHCRGLAMRMEVERRVKEGVRKVEAMHAVAQEFCCSYELVRKYVYYEPALTLPPPAL